MFRQRSLGGGFHAEVEQSQTDIFNPVNHIMHGF